MAKIIYVLNGPNLNLLGKREPEIYGSQTLDDVRRMCETLASESGLRIVFHQSNAEHELIDWVHEAREAASGIVINPAGFSFNSIPVLDALKMFDGPVIEIHISNIHARDELHRHSILSTVTRTVICGAGAYGYNLALLAAVNALGLRPNALPDPLSTGPV